MSSEKVYKCQRCGITFGTLRSLSSHLLAAHEKEITSVSPRRTKPVKKTSKTNKDAAQQSVVHICEVCNTTFYSAKSLKYVLSSFFSLVDYFGMKDTT